MSGKGIEMERVVEGDARACAQVIRRDAAALLAGRDEVVLEPGLQPSSIEAYDPAADRVLAVWDCHLTDEVAEGLVEILDAVARGMDGAPGVWYEPIPGGVLVVPFGDNAEEVAAREGWLAELHRRAEVA